MDLGNLFTGEKPLPLRFNLLVDHIETFLSIQITSQPETLTSEPPQNLGNYFILPKILSLRVFKLYIFHNKYVQTAPWWQPEGCWV